MRIKRNRCRTVALLLCILMLLSSVATALNSMISAASDDEYGIMPMADYNWVGWWELHKNGSRVGNQVNLWNSGTWNADTIQEAYVRLDKIDLSQASKDEIAADLATNYVVKIESNSGYNYVITNVTYNTGLSTEGELWIFTLTIDNNGDSIQWNGRGPMIFNVGVPDINAPEKIQGGTGWRLASGVGGSDSTESGWLGSTVTLSDTILPDQVMTYGETIKSNYRLEVSLNDGAYREYEIKTVEYDASRSNRLEATYKIVSKDTFYWKDQSQKMEFYVTLQIEHDPPLAGVTGWLLSPNDYSWEKSAGEGEAIVYPKRVDSESELAALEEEILASCNVKLQYTDGYSNQALEFLPDSLEISSRSARSVTYRLTLSNMDEALKTYDLVWMKTGDPVDHLYITVLVGPQEYTINAWRIVYKDGGNEIGLKYNSDSPMNLPERIASSDIETFMEAFTEKYELQVRYTDGGAFETAEVTRLNYSSGTKYTFELVTRDIYRWGWGSASFRVAVTDVDADPVEYQNLSHWQVVGFSQTRAVGLAIILNNVDYRTEVEGKEEEFAKTLSTLYSQIGVGYGDGSWYYSIINDIAYSPDESKNLSSSIRTVAAYKVTVYDRFLDGSRKEVEFYIAITAPANFGDLSSITATSREPQGITMHLFDYWTVTDNPRDEAGNPWDVVINGDTNAEMGSNDPRYNSGINAGHLLKLFYNSPTYGAGWRDEILSYGVWNHSTTNERPNIQGIVQSLLSNGYPILNLNADLSEKYDDPWLNFRANTLGKLRETYTQIEDARNESLAYLFDPTYSHTGKATYKNISGLLQMDSQGYYYYDSKLNFAQFDKLTNSIILYNTWGVTPAGTSPHGQFFPFNDAGEVFSGTKPATDENGNVLRDENGNVLEEYDENGQRTLVRVNEDDDNENDVDSRSEIMNHHFGFTMEIDFQQPLGGRVNPRIESIAEDMVFKFAGDDDCWIFVDGVLVLDLGGVHSGVYGEINFATGEVRTGLMDYEIDTGVKMSGNAWTSTTLHQIFTDAGVANDSDIAWNGDTFADDTLHTLQLFYMERGHWDSNFAMYFNLQPRVPHKIYKVDEDGYPLADAQFALYAAAPLAGEYDSTAAYHTADEFAKVDASFSGNSVAWEDPGVQPMTDHFFTTGNDGYVTLGGIDFATRASATEGQQIYYILEEVGPPEGARKLLKPLVLQYIPNEETLKGVFTVLNQYETGAYASFSAIIEDNQEKMYYATTTVKTDEDGINSFDIESTEAEIQGIHQDSAMLFAVPMIYTDIGNGYQWYPIYGSNTAGYRVVDIYKPEDYFDHDDSNDPALDGNKEADMLQNSYRWALRHNLLAAALRQVSDEIGPDWYFRYETITDAEGKVAYSRFTAELNNLPGDSSRYLVNNRNVTDLDYKDVDLRLIGVLVDAEAIAALLHWDTTPKDEPDENGSYDSDDVKKFKNLSDEEKYLLLQNYLISKNFESRWDETYNADGDWSWVTDVLDTAYTVKGAENTSRDRGVNLADINSFTRYYGSVFYVPNERRELRVLKQDENGNPIEGAEFGLYETFEDAVDLAADPLAKGITDRDGLLIFSIEADRDEAGEVIPGHATVDWNAILNEAILDADGDNLFWVREIKAPKGYKLNSAIVQVYVGDLTIYANASAYKSTGEGEDDKPVKDAVSGKYERVLIDEDILKTDDASVWQSGAGDLNTDGVTVWASVGKLFQSMEKFADTLLNTTLLDIDAFDYLYIANVLGDFDNPELFFDDPERFKEFWKQLSSDAVSMHFWDDQLDFRSVFSEYSSNHDDPTDATAKTYSSTENGYLWMHPQQSSSFAGNHHDDDSIINSRRDDLTGVDITRVFSPVNVIVMRDEESNPAMTIEKHQSRNAEPKTKEKLEVNGGDVVTYYLTVESCGNDTATDVVVTDKVPYTAPYALSYIGNLKYGTFDEDGVTIHWSPIAEVVGVSAEYDETTSTVTWNLGNMKEGTRVIVSFDVAVPYVTETTDWINSGILTFGNNPDNAPEGPPTPIPSNEVVIEETVYNLSVSKTVVGPDDDLSKKWDFTLTLTLPTGALTEYSYVIKDQTGSVIESGKMTAPSHTFQLRHGDTITFYGLPYGTGYTVTEDKTGFEDWATTVNGVASSTATGQLTSGVHDVFARFTNSAPDYNPSGSLTVKKLTTDGGGNTSFTFRVTLTLPADTEPSGSYTYTGAVNGTFAFTKGADGLYTCVIDVRLKHGETVTFVDLPVGTKYTVEETELNGYVLAEIESSHESQSIQRDLRLVSGEIEEAEEHSVTFVNTMPVELPQVGGMGRTVFYLAGTVTLLFAGVCLIFTRKKKRA